MNLKDRIKTFKKKYLKWRVNRDERLINKFLLEEETKVHNQLLNYIENAYPSKEVYEYRTRFSENDIGILKLFDIGCSPEEAQKYDLRFDATDVAALFEKKCSPEKSNEYDKRFNGIEISELFTVSCSPEKANEYAKKFDGEEISHLFKIGCTPKEAEEYASIKDGILIWILYSIGLKPSNSSVNKKERLNGMIGKIVSFVSGVVNSVEGGDYTLFNLLGTGISGAVLSKGNSAWKFAENINNEYLLLKKIQDYHKGNQKNIINVKGVPKEGFVLELEYIQGDSLENILKKQYSLSEEKTVKYAADILNGLIEMRQSGVLYHRDIRPANVLIDKKEDRAVIIDFGIATTKKRARTNHNRRYGGFDLISLGQLMYKMITGEHVFAESKSMEKTTLAQKIKDYRDTIYSDNTGALLKKHLDLIDEKLRDEKLKELIKSCLIAKKDDYEKIQQMFKEFY